MSELGNHGDAWCVELLNSEFLVMHFLIWKSSSFSVASPWTVYWWRFLQIAEDESVTSLSVDASRKALEMADVKPEDVDLLLLCTSTPDDLFGSAPQVLLVNRFLPPHAIGNMNITKNHLHIIKKCLNTLLLVVVTCSSSDLHCSSSHPSIVRLCHSLAISPWLKFAFWKERIVGTYITRQWELLSNLGLGLDRNLTGYGVH